MATNSINFERYLVSKRIKYIRHEGNIFQIDYQGQQLKNINLSCAFLDEDPDTVLVMCTNFAKCTKDTMVLACMMCNGMNSVMPYIRFYVDDDMEIIARCDLKVHPEYFCDDIIETMNLMAETVDNTYEDFEKELWS